MVVEGRLPAASLLIQAESELRGRALLGVQAGSDCICVELFGPFDRERLDTIAIGGHSCAPE
jgi:hypothetical protein